MLFGYFSKQMNIHPESLGFFPIQQNNFAVSFNPTIASLYDGLEGEVTGSLARVAIDS